MAKDSMTFKLFGHDISLSKAFVGAGKASGDFEKKAKGNLHNVGGAFKSMGTIAGGVIGGLTLKSLGDKAMDFGKQSFEAFEKTSTSASKMQRYMGGSIEDASRLNHALQMKGLGVDDAARSLGIFSKMSSNAGQQLSEYEKKQAVAAQTGKAFKGHLGSAAAAMSQVGIALRGPTGEMRPMKEMLMDAAEQFKNMPEGADRTALAMKLFGRNGMAMLPFLKEGKKGINELMQESDKLGTTIGPKDQAAVKESVANKRRLGEAVKGLQISFGRSLLPMVEKVVKFMGDKLVPALKIVIDWIAKNVMPWVEKFADQLGKRLQPVIKTVGEWFEKNKDKIKDFGQKIFDLAKTIMEKVVPAVVAFGGWLIKYQGWLIPIAGGILAIVAAFKLYQLYVTIVSTVTKIWTGIQAAFNIVMNMNPIGLIVLAVVGLVVALVIAYKRSETFRNIVNGAFHGVLKVVKSVWNWIKNNWQLLLAIITGPIGIAVKLIHDHWGTIKNGAKAAVKWITDKFGSLVSFFTGLPKKLSNAVKTLWNGLTDSFKTALNFLIDGWNSLDFGLHVHLPSWLGGAGFDIDDIIPDIPRLAMGGIVTQPTLALIGEAGPEAVVPLTGRNGVGGNVTHVHINPQVMAGTEDVMARAMVKALNDYQRRGGRLQFMGA